MALAVMLLVGRDFLEGKPGWTPEQLASYMELPVMVLSPIVHRLQGNGLLQLTDDQRLIPTRSLDKIKLADIVSAVRSFVSGERVPAEIQLKPVLEVVDGMEAAARESLSERSLRDLVEASDTD